MYERAGIIGSSVMDLAVDAVRSLALLHRALEQVLTEDQPALHPAVTLRRARDFDVAAHRDLGDVLAELDDVAPAFADRVDGIHGDDWTRIGTIAGTPEQVTALGIVQEAVSTAADDLRDIEGTMRQFRGR
jgi:hypothetical protein